MCELCGSNYGLNGGSCIKCEDVNCQDCSPSSSYCIKCDSNFTNNNGICQVAVCPDQNCLDCGESVGCNICASGSYLNVDTCSPCTDVACLSCPYDPSFCTACFPEYANSNGTCSNTLCDNSNCLTCADPTVCTSCGLGYQLQSGSCLPCSDSLCMVCSASLSTCTECFKGSVNDVGTCTQSNCLDQNCLACPSTSVCEECGSGYALNNGTCDPCLDVNCINCAYNSGVDFCLQCFSGYVNDKGTCLASKCNDTNCLTCTTDPTACEVCGQGYGLQEGSCVPCSDSNCLNCERNPSYCMSCYIGFANDNGSCVNSSCLDSSCLVCSDISICETCGAGTLL